MGNRDGIYTKRSRFILVFGGAFGILFTGMMAYVPWRDGVLDAEHALVLVVTGIMAGAFWGTGMWYFARWMNDRIHHRGKGSN
jgi:hypothetical protein